MGFQNINDRIGKQYFKNNKKKEALSLWREMLRIQEAQRKLGYIELEKPVFKGYKKFFVLREDYCNRDDAYVFKEILQHVQNEIHCRDKLFLTKDWKTGKKIPMEHSICTLTKKKYDSLSDRCKKYFISYWHTNKYNKQRELRYQFTIPYIFLPKMDKWYITKLPVIDSELKRREKEIEKQLHSNKEELWSILHKAMGWRHSYWDSEDDKQKYASDLYFKE